MNPTEGAPPATPPAPPSLKARIVRAGSWSMLAHGSTLVLRLANSLIMTRLLAPEAFGLMALVVTIAVVATLLSDIGLRQAVVHSQHGDDPVMLDTAWTMQIVRGALIWGVCCLIALGLHSAREAGWLNSASVYAAPDLPLLLVLSTFNSFLMGFETTKRFTADRRIEQKRVVLIELTALFIGMAVIITLAAIMRSVWAIPIGGAVGTVCSVAMGHRLLHGHTNRLAWNADYARQIFHYGKWILASSLLYVLASNGDKLLLGMWFTPAMLGCFSIGQNLAQMLEMAMARIFGQVAPPAFGDVLRTNPQRLREVYLRMRLPVDVLFIGAAGFLFAVGPGVVHLMYDARYAEAGSILRTLSFALLFARYGLSASAYLALQQPHAQAAMSLMRVICFFTIVPLAYESFGAQGAYWAIALHSAATIPVVWYFDRRFGIFSWRQEVLPLAVWPVGWALGWLVALALPAGPR